MSDVFISHASDEMGVKYTAFVKVLPSNPSRCAAGFIGGSYQRESADYHQWLPELKLIRCSKNLNNSEVPLNVTDLYFVNLAFSKDGNCLEIETVCFLEELKSKGYRMGTSARSANGVDLNHAKVALVTYANYHALSVVNQDRLVKSNGPGDYPSAYEIFRKDPNYISPAIVHKTIVLPQFIKGLGHFQRKEVADRLEGLLPHLEKIWDWESFLDSAILTCLLHSDSWNNDLLFRYPGETSNIPRKNVAD